MKIAIIGNGGGGKTTLARNLAEKTKIPLFIVDNVQFLPELKRRPIEETREIVDGWISHSSWIIDGFGPIDSIEKRFCAADRIIFVDFPLWRHYLWATKRQISSIWKARSELPENCNEATLQRTWELYRILWRVHKKIRPELFEIINRNKVQDKVTWITQPTDLAFNTHNLF